MRREPRGARRSAARRRRALAFLIRPREASALIWRDLIAAGIASAFPGYITAWYVWRAWQFVGKERVGTSEALALIGLNARFWLATAWYTRRVYDALPAECSGCFIVTAATRGHPAIVGPFVELAPGRRVNRQLVRFWRFEDAWRAGHPASHAAVRRVYDRVAPPIAARIRSRWCADVVYLLLKPLELLVAAATTPAARRDGSDRHAAWPKRVDQLDVATKGDRRLTSRLDVRTRM